MGNLCQKEMEEIECSLVSFDSNIQKNIKQEYYTLKEMLINQSQMRKQQNPNITSYSLNKRLLVNPINVSKRLERIGKWIKMIFPSNKPHHTPSNNKTNSNNTSFRSENDHRSSNNSNQQSSLSTIKKKNMIFKLSSPHRNKNTSVDINGFDNNQHSVIESNLRNYYSVNKDHFKERTAKGPPNSLRWISWLIVSTVPKVRSYKVYLNYLLEEIDDSVDMQICKDLNRTASEFNSNKENLIIGSGNYEDKLYRLLRAFSNADKMLGYCQGLNFITGFLLTVSDNNEIETFYMLVALLNNKWNIRGLFIEEFPLLNYYIDIFDAIMEKECNDIRKHLLKLDMPNEVWISKWIQTLYTISLPYDINLRIWDYLLTNGIEFIISFSITMLMALEKDIKAFDDAYDLLEFFKAFFSSTLNSSNCTSNNTNSFQEIKDKEANLDCNDGNSNLKVVYSTDSCLKEKKILQINTILKQSEKLHKTYLYKDFFRAIKKNFLNSKESNNQAFKIRAVEMNPSNEKFLIAKTLNSFNTNKTNFKSDLFEEENDPINYRDDISNECLIKKASSNAPVIKQFTENNSNLMKPKQRVIK